MSWGHFFKNYLHGQQIDALLLFVDLVFRFSSPVQCLKDIKFAFAARVIKMLALIVCLVGSLSPAGSHYWQTVGQIRQLKVSHQRIPVCLD